MITPNGVMSQKSNQKSQVSGGNVLSLPSEVHPKSQQSQLIEYEKSGNTNTVEQNVQLRQSQEQVRSQKSSMGLKPDNGDDDHPYIMT